MEKLTKRIIEKNCFNWNSVQLKHYKRIIKLQIPNSLDKEWGFYANIISILTGENIKEIKQLPMADSIYLIREVRKFIESPIPHSMFWEGYKLKELKEFTMDDFISISQIKPEDIYEEHSVRAYLRLFVNEDKKELEPKEIDEISIPLIQSSFFLVTKKLDGSMKLTLRKKILKELMKNSLKKLFQIQKG